MPNIRYVRLWFGGLLSLCLAATATAGTVSILSGSDLTAATEWNGSLAVRNPDVLINAYGEPVWKAPTLGGEWISYTLSGVGQGSVASVALDINGNIAGPPAASFFYQFFLPGPAISGQVGIWVDDTAAVFIDGLPVIPLSQPPVRSQWCASGVISCQPALGGVVDLSTLTAGVHTLSIDAYQVWGNTFGLLYEGSVTFADVPEPSTFALLGGALCLVLAGRSLSVRRP